MKFNYLPTLEGDLIRLEPARPGDFERLYAVAKDPKIWEQHPQRHRYQGDAFRQFFADGVAGTGMLLIIDRASGDVIGSSRFYDFDLERKWICIGYTFLACAYWGGTYNGDLKRTMLRHAFAQEIDSVIFHVGEGNTRSRKAVEKLGARLINRDERTMPDGTVSMRLWYQLPREIAIKPHHAAAAISSARLSQRDS